jgi:hypothetical protein
LAPANLPHRAVVRDTTQVLPVSSFDIAFSTRDRAVANSGSTAYVHQMPMQTLRLENMAYDLSSSRFVRNAGFLSSTNRNFYPPSFDDSNPPLVSMFTDIMPMVLSVESALSFYD